MLKIAVGPNEGKTEWTEAVMKAYQARQWSWDMHGLSLHADSVRQAALVEFPPEGR